MSVLDMDDYVMTPTVVSSAANTITTEPNPAKEVKQAKRVKDFRLIPIWFTFPDGEQFFIPRAGLPADSKRLDDVYTRHLEGKGDRNFIPSIGHDWDWDDDLIADVSSGEFRSLLKLTCRFVLEGEEELTVEDWMSILKLTTLWDMPDTHTRVVKGLDEEIKRRTAAEKMLLAKRFNVEEWFIDGFKAFVTMGQQISVTERDELGWETYARLLEAKDKAWALAYANYQRLKTAKFSGTLKADCNKLYHEAFGSSCQWAAK